MYGHSKLIQGNTVFDKLCLQVIELLLCYGMRVFSSVAGRETKILFMSTFHPEVIRYFLDVTHPQSRLLCVRRKLWLPPYVFLVPGFLTVLDCEIHPQNKIEHSHATTLCMLQFSIHHFLVIGLKSNYFFTPL